MDRGKAARLAAAVRGALLSDAGLLIVVTILMAAGIAGLLVLEGDEFLRNH